MVRRFVDLSIFLENEVVSVLYRGVNGCLFLAEIHGQELSIYFLLFFELKVPEGIFFNHLPFVQVTSKIKGAGNK